MKKILSIIGIILTIYISFHVSIFVHGYGYLLAANIKNFYPKKETLFTSIPLISWRGERGSISVNWVDYNNDGFLDLWIAPHAINSFLNEVILLKNNAGENFTRQELPNLIRQGDTHGNSWADYDNDNDKDLFIVTGAGGLRSSTGYNRFVENNQGNLVEKDILANGLAYGYGAGRGILWLDYNFDGKLDVIEFTEKRPDGLGQTALFEQQSNGTFAQATDIGFDLPDGAVFGITADLKNDGNQDLIVINDEKTVKIFEIKNGQFKEWELFNKQPKSFYPKYVKDIMTGDFNNDGYLDIFYTRVKNTPTNVQVLEKTKINQIFSKLAVDKSKKSNGFSFQSKGEITIDFFDSRFTKIIADTGNVNLTNQQIFLGYNQQNPLTSDGESLNLNSQDLIVQGIVKTQEKNQPGLYIGNDPKSSKWSIELVGLPQISRPRDAQDDSYLNNIQGISLAVKSTMSINEIETNFESFDLKQLALQPILFLYEPQQKEFFDASQKWLDDLPISSKSAISGDFDNDGDLDIYLTQDTTYTVEEPIYLENRGDHFRRIREARGATFQGGLKFEDFNIGVNTATADYNNDGFLDIVVGASTFKTNDRAILRGRESILGNDYHLFQNQGNENNWLILNLVGTNSGVEAFGTKVYLTSGETTQYRELTSGAHRLAQNDNRIHFGLGSNEMIDNLTIEWPSGTVQEFQNLKVNQIFSVTEAAPK